MAIETERLRDLVPEILSRLPVKSLMRFQCVQKTWYDLIKTPYFISNHLHNFNKRSGYLINEYNNQCVVSLLSFDRENHEFDENDKFSLRHQNLEFNWNRLLDLEICGPCNGIYYLHYRYYWQNTSMLINPSKREFRFLPKLDSAPFDCLKTYGFGFDHKTNDYKVFWIMSEFTEEHLFQKRVFIYILSSDSWREALTLAPSYSFCCQSNAFAHGAFHRAALDDGRPIILAFDMTEEVFRKIRLPAEENGLFCTIKNFRETIAAIFEPSSTLIMDLWVMKEYGNEGSWFKYLKIGSWEWISRLLETWDDEDNFLMKDYDGRIVSYDLNTQEIKTVGVHAEIKSGFFPAVLYMESLVSLRRDNEQGLQQVSLC